MLTTITQQQPVVVDKQDAPYHHGRAASSPIQRDPAALDPFYYGWREVLETLPDGRLTYHEEPLTLANFLDPQEGDHFVQGDKHFLIVNSIFNRFDQRYRNHPTIGVYSDLKIIWGIPDLSEPAPDISVIPNVQTKSDYHGSFDVVAEGTRPCLVVEVTSPRYQVDDTDKVSIYEQAGIAEYIILNPHYEDENLPMELKGYRLVDGKYAPMIPDAAGRLLSETTGIWFELDEWGLEVVLTDAVTGECLLTKEEEHAARLAAEQRADQETQRADQEAQRAEQEHQARLAAEAKLAQEQEDRLAALAQVTAAIARMQEMEAEFSRYKALLVSQS